MITIHVDKMQSLWDHFLLDPLDYTLFINRYREFVSYGLIDIEMISLFYIDFLLFHSLTITPPPCNFSSLFQKLSESKAILFETVWAYAMIEKKEYKRNKAKSPAPCVNVCASSNNWNILSLGKAQVAYKRTFHRLLTTEFNNKFNLKPGDKVIPKGDCGIKDCTRYQKLLPNGKSSCCNTLGACAEQRAANEILHEPKCNAQNIDDLEFSWALRPRTMTIVPYCYNCKTIFPQLS